jgi:hypothetical protein
MYMDLYDDTSVIKVILFFRVNSGGHGGPSINNPLYIYKTAIVRLYVVRNIL